MKTNVIIPTVGMPATWGVGSDCYAMTITWVSNSGRAVKARMNQCVCKDYYAGDWEILPSLEGETHKFTLRKNGRWVEEGVRMSSGGCYANGLFIGSARRYENPSF